MNYENLIEEDRKVDANMQIENEIRNRIDKIIEAENYEEIRDRDEDGKNDEWKKLCLRVIEDHPKDAVRIIQVLQQTEK